MLFDCFIVDFKVLGAQLVAITVLCGFWLGAVHISSDARCSYNLELLQQARLVEYIS